MREFTNTDFNAWGGAERFSDDSLPYIHENDESTIIADSTGIHVWNDTMDSSHISLDGYSKESILAIAEIVQKHYEPQWEESPEKEQEIKEVDKVSMRRLVRLERVLKLVRGKVMKSTELQKTVEIVKETKTLFGLKSTHEALDKAIGALQFQAYFEELYGTGLEIVRMNDGVRVSFDTLYDSALSDVSDDPDVYFV